MADVTGGCHCGSVRWSVSLPPQTVVQCHCSNCRRLQGSDYSSWVVLDPVSFKIDDGATLLSTYETELSRKDFCSKCGSAVFLKNGKHFPDSLILPLGSFHEFDESLTPQVQVYTDSRAPWVALHSTPPAMS